MASSPYVRLKLLLSPVVDASTSGAASVSLVVRKVEVPRSLAFASLATKLAKLFGLPADAVCDCHVALDAEAAGLTDAVVARSELVAHLTWAAIDSDEAWEQFTHSADKMLVKITRHSVSAANSSASASAPAPVAMKRPFDVRVHMRPVMPRKQHPSLFKKFAPAPGSLPLIIVDNEHEWELLDDDFEHVEDETKVACNKKADTKKASAPKTSNKTASKINRVAPPELLAKLVGGANAMPAPTSSVTFDVNGRTFTVANPSPQVKLIEFLRYEVGITGSKIGCGEGGCGACTIVLSRKLSTGQMVQFSTNGCLHPIAALDGWAVTTSEGLGSEHTKLHPVQQSMVDNWATQCGYCSNGMVMSMYGLLVNNPTPTKQQIEDGFDGNLCRCTGYRPIFKAMRAVVPGLEDGEEEKKQGGCKSGGCGCASKGCGSSSASSSSCSSTPAALSPCGKGDGAGCSSGAKAACNSQGIGCGSHSPSGASDIEDLIHYDPTNPTHNVNPISPKLAEYNHRSETAKAQNAPQAVRWTADTTSLWFEPQSISDVTTILAHYAGSTDVVKLVVGNSSIGVEKYYPLNPAADHPTVFVNLAQLPGLLGIELVPNDGLYLGAAVTLRTVIETLESAIASSPAAQVSTWAALVRHIKMIANTGVRAVGSWCGNLMIAKNHPEFPSDLLTIFGSFGCELTLVSASHGSRTVLVQDFQTFAMYSDELVQQIRIPMAPSGVQFVFDSYKIRARHQNSHPIINAAYCLILSTDRNPSGNYTIRSSNMLIGGLKTGVFQAQQTMGLIANMELSVDTMTQAIACLDKEAVAEGRSNADATYHVADPKYRHSLVVCTFYKFFLEQLAAAGVALPPRDVSAFDHYVRPISSGVEVFTPDATTAPVGQAIPKLESRMQCTGEAKYVDDLPIPANMLWGTFVYSTVGVGTIASIDASVALSMPGVERFISAADIAALPGASNDCGSFPGDEEIFASKEITGSGQSIGMILADTRAHADAAAAAVVVNYSSTPKPIVTIEDAMACVPPSILDTNQYMTKPPPITCGDFDKAYAAAPHQVSGTTVTGGQAHFCMETQTCFTVPQENDGLYVHSSSQGPTDIRGVVMRAVGLPAHKITVSTRRTGGAFGSKLSRAHPIACATALAARITNRPVRAQCSRTGDLDQWGKRPAMNMDWKVGFDDNGKMVALDTTFYQQGGHTYDANFGILSMALLWADGSYYCPNFTVTGVTCRTNTPANTAMRGPGAFESVWHVEKIMEVIATTLGKSPNEVREANFYVEGQLAPYQQPIKNVTMQRCWAQVKAQSAYDQNLVAVNKFNSENKWRKRGVHMSATKYGITVPGNQVGILLNVMQDDGTIVVSHTGVEIGQGINTKVAQTIAYALGIDLALIVIDDNATNIVANGTETGGSATSESACQAALIACEDFNTRLAPIKKDNPGLAWADLIAKASAAFVNLTVSAQFNCAVPDDQQPFSYWVWGAACSQVELDVLTGEVQVLSTDIVYDNGNSLNPAVDIGQIEGAFIMGLGHFLTEEVEYDAKTARLTTRGTWDYHPPSSQDIPLVMNVTLLDGAKNPMAGSVLGSKATAEPPMMLSGSVYFALRDCVASVRADQGLGAGWFELPVPCTTQVVQLACGITASQLVL